MTVYMNEAEHRVIGILTSHRPTLKPLGEPILSVEVGMGWESAKAMAFVEYLMLCRLIVLKTETIDKATEPKRKARSWWESGRTC